MGGVPHFVGLSATLMEAEAFFSQLTGVPESAVEEVSPEAGELESEGMEYLVAVRGDPVSGTSLLSTTIQTAMLMRRILDPQGSALSEGAYGQKVFVFTDDLDVTNRLYFDLNDAEGMNYFNNLPINGKMPLANLRTRLISQGGGGHAGDMRRFLHGQRWDLCEQIGHSLDRAGTVRVGRVSSQDSGVDPRAEILVATASLEVGFNDPQTGAILQHKAPRGAAAFLQRMGRAGRRRDMRPLTVVVLSDYGRDRIAYQGYDLLFDPELSPRSLPMGNRHVIKMQAVYGFLDWVADRLAERTVRRFSLWSNLSGPVDDNDPFADANRDIQGHVAAVVEETLAQKATLDDLGEWLREALGLRDSDEVRPLLWEAPRALMTTVLPTLLRRLRSNWEWKGEPSTDLHLHFHPLPDFVPNNLFSDLNLPEVAIRLVQERNGQEKEHHLPIGQALREFAPGRLSRRYSVADSEIQHWLPIDPTGCDCQPVVIDRFCRGRHREEVGWYPYQSSSGEVRRVLVMRPFVMNVAHDVPEELASGNAQLEWRSQILPPSSLQGFDIDLPTKSPWTDIIRQIRFFTHRDHQSARICRFALGSRADLTLRPHNQAGCRSRQLRTYFQARVLDEGGEEIEVTSALGFSFRADALRVRVRIPVDWKLEGAGISKLKMAGLRAAFFRWSLCSDPDLERLEVNIFQRQWLAEIVLGALTATALGDGTDLELAWSAIAQGTGIGLGQVLEVIFQSIATSDDEEDASEGSSSHSGPSPRRAEEMRGLLHNSAILQVLERTVPVLWMRLDGSKWQAWLRATFLSTLGAALRDAIEQMCPDLDVDDLVVDLDPGISDSHEAVDKASEGEADIWISETTPGGGGVVERLLQVLAVEPRRFLNLVQAALDESDFEVSDRELKRILEWLTGGSESELVHQVDQFRQATSQEEQIAAFETFLKALTQRGVLTNHSVVSAISSRLLRPGSNVKTDELLFAALDGWSAQEERLGVEIGARSFAYALSESTELDNALGNVLPLVPGQDKRQWRFSTLYGLLWPRGAQPRNYALSLRNPYAEIQPTERLLVCDCIAGYGRAVAHGANAWEDDLLKTLATDGRATITTGVESLESFRVDLLRLLVAPVDAGSLLLYPRLRSIIRDSGQLRIDLELATGLVADAESSVEGQATSTSRLIVRTANGGRDEIRDLLESLFATDLLAPGNTIWLVSPWITDLPILDNRSGGYSGLEPSWNKRQLSLAELLAYALRRSANTRVQVVTRPVPQNQRFCERLKALAEVDGTSDRLFIDCTRTDLHIKGLAGSSYSLKGSMNFTYNGVEVLEEAVELELDTERVARFLLNLNSHYSRGGAGATLSGGQDS